MKMPNVFNGVTDVSSKLDDLALFFARLLSGSLDALDQRAEGRKVGGCLFGHGFRPFSQCPRTAEAPGGPSAARAVLRVTIRFGGPASHR